MFDLTIIIKDVKINVSVDRIPEVGELITIPSYEGEYVVRFIQSDIIKGASGNLYGFKNTSIRVRRFGPPDSQDKSLEEIKTLRKALEFASRKEKSSIEKMLRKRGGVLQVNHCACGELADSRTGETYECLICYEKGYGNND